MRNHKRIHLTKEFLKAIYIFRRRQNCGKFPHMSHCPLQAFLHSLKLRLTCMPRHTLPRPTKSQAFLPCPLLIHRLSRFPITKHCFCFYYTISKNACSQEHFYAAVNVLTGKILILQVVKYNFERSSYEVIIPHLFEKCKQKFVFLF